MGKKLFYITREALTDILIAGKLVFVQQGLPKDARIVGFDFEASMDTYRILVESSRFKNQSEGILYPKHEPVFVSINTQSQVISDIDEY